MLCSVFVVFFCCVVFHRVMFKSRSCVFPRMFSPVSVTTIDVCGLALSWKIMSGEVGLPVGFTLMWRVAKGVRPVDGLLEASVK